MSRYPQYPGVPMRDRTEAYMSAGVVARFMNMVYAWMCVGLVLTALVAWVVSQNHSLLRSIFQPGTLIVLLLVELALVWVIAASIEKLSAATATVLFLIYAALNGLTLSAVFLVYSLGSVGATFCATAGMFGVMSIYGFVTKRDLTSLGSFLFMALIGLIIASLLNLFLFPNEQFYWIITYAGILIFLGLTAYDTQKLKMIAYATEGDPQLAARLAISGALSLYLDFINLFLYLLRILGKARD